VLDASAYSAPRRCVVHFADCSGLPRGIESVEKVLNFKIGLQDLEKVLNLAET